MDDCGQKEGVLSVSGRRRVVLCCCCCPGGVRDQKERRGSFVVGLSNSSIELCFFAGPFFLRFVLVSIFPFSLSSFWAKMPMPINANANPFLCFFVGFCLCRDVIL